MEQNELDQYDVSGTIHCNKVANSRAVRRLVQKRIANWVRSQRFIGPQGKAHFDVSFVREGSGHLIGCRILVRVGNKVWQGSYCTDGLHKAFVLCLERMTPQLHGGVA